METVLACPQLPALPYYLPLPESKLLSLLLSSSNIKDVSFCSTLPLWCSLIDMRWWLKDPKEVEKWGGAGGQELKTWWIKPITVKCWFFQSEQTTGRILSQTAVLKGTSGQQKVRDSQKKLARVSFITHYRFIYLKYCCLFFFFKVTVTIS